jgi:DNA invertase Pin-like site-specific DNA recombinase
MGRHHDRARAAYAGSARRLAEFERELIRARTGDGRERAKAQGMRMGRKPKLTDHQKCEAIKRCDHGDETLAEIGRSYNVSGWTISRLA